MPMRTLQRVLIWLLIVATTVYLLDRVFSLVSLFSTPLLLFGLAWLVALVLRPLADDLTRLRLPSFGSPPAPRYLSRSVAVTLLYTLILATGVVGVIAFAPIIGPQIAAVQQLLPSSLDTAVSL